MYDYAIYGGGPSGLILSYIISLNGYNVILIEKESKLGGCWKTEWLENKYFSEHSPRVLFPNNNGMIKILDHFGMDMEKELSPNSPSGTGITNVVTHVLSQLSFLDMFKLLNLLVFKNSGNMTVKEWYNKHNISHSGKNILKILSIVLANSPDKLLMSEIFNDASMTGIFNKYPRMSQFVNHSKWVDVFESKLVEMGVVIKKGKELNQLIEKNNVISSGILKDGEIINSKNHILTFPPVAFYNFMKNQSFSNWMPINELKKWMLDSYYASIGFQLHFNEEMQFPGEWCWSCDNDYNLIVVDVSKYTNEISKDPSIKSVWSCTVVSTDNYIKNRNKTVNELDIETIISDCVDILNVKPYKITTTPGIHKEYNKYMSTDTAFSLGKSGVIPFKGKIENLYTVGPHNISGITNMGKASKSALLFCKYLEMIIPAYLKENSWGLFTILFILLVFYIVLWFLTKLNF
jgi:hypothetical protein